MEGKPQMEQVKVCSQVFLEIIKRESQPIQELLLLIKENYDLYIKQLRQELKD